MRLLLLLSAALVLPRTGQAQSIQWIGNFHEGMKLARESHLPVMIDFWSQWCIPCQRMEKEAYADSRIIDLSGRFVCIRVNVDDDRSSAKHFGIEKLPAKLFLDPWETVLVKDNKYSTASELAEIMKPLPESFEPVSDSFAELEKDSANRQALLEIAACYLKAGFAAACVYLGPRYQKDSQFCYLGRQSSKPFAHVIAFRQVSGKTELLGKFSFNGEIAYLETQGLVWVDPETSQIVRMVMEDQPRRASVGLAHLKSEIVYAPVRFSPRPEPFWLPKDVVVTFEYQGVPYRNTHRYSNYRLFTVESYEKRGILPASSTKKRD